MTPCQLTGFVILLGDFNGDLGNSLRDKGKKESNDRGLLLLDFAKFFNICPVNHLKHWKGPLESFNSHCERYHSTLDYIFLPNCLLNNIDSPETFEQDVDNTSDHLPILVNLKFSERLAIDLNCQPVILVQRLSEKSTGQISLMKLSM